MVRMKPRRKMLNRIAACSVGLCCIALFSTVRADDASEQIRAVNYLGSVDCGSYPESQTALIQTMRGDASEAVRLAAVQALTQQLQCCPPPCDPTLGWRPFPDPGIRRKIASWIPRRRADCDDICGQPWLSQRQAQHFNTCPTCCTPELIAALSAVAYGKDERGSPLEPSERVRAAALRALAFCCDVTTMAPSETPPAPLPPTIPPRETTPPSTTPPAPPTERQPSPLDAPAAETPQFAPPTSSLVAGSGPGANTPILLGRADMTNRLNLFDNGSAQPRTRVWFGLQFVGTQNTGIDYSDQTKRLFQSLDQTAPTRVNPNQDFITAPVPTQSLFQSATGFSTANAFLTANGTPGTKFINRGNAMLYRFGFEYAMTNDFSVAMTAQYADPLQDQGQPALWTNPSVTLKHVLYRSETSVYSGLFSVSPQIPQPQFGIVEDTTRIIPGFIASQSLTDRLFLQWGTQLNMPTESNRIVTADYAVGLGYWAYQHASVRDPGIAQPWLRGVIPQFEVLGKHALNGVQIAGLYGIPTGAPQTAAGGTVFFPDGTGDSFGTGGLFVYREPRHIVDMTVGGTLLFRHNVLWSHGVSFPITGGNARRVEYLTTVNFLF